MMPELFTSVNGRGVFEGFFERGMGVWGKGTALEFPCPTQHCRNLLCSYS